MKNGLIKQPIFIEGNYDETTHTTSIVDFIGDETVGVSCQCSFLFWAKKEKGKIEDVKYINRVQKKVTTTHIQ